LLAQHDVLDGRYAAPVDEVRADVIGVAGGALDRALAAGPVEERGRAAVVDLDRLHAVLFVPGHVAAVGPLFLRQTVAVGVVGGDLVDGAARDAGDGVRPRAAAA